MKHFSRDPETNLHEILIAMAEAGVPFTNHAVYGGHQWTTWRQNAPNPPESSIPGVVLGAFVDDTKSGRFFHASDFGGMSLQDAVKNVESLEDSH